MRSRLLIALVVGFSTSLAPFVVVAQDVDSTKPAVAAAMSVLDEYMSHFNRRDLQAWATTLNYPHVRFASGEVTIWDSERDFVTGSQTFVNLPRTGWDHSHWLSREITMASPEKVHIETVFQRFNRENEPIGTYQSLYIVTNVDGHWGIQARSSLAP